MRVCTGTAMQRLIGTPLYCLLAGEHLIHIGPPSLTDWSKNTVTEFGRAKLRLQALNILVENGADVNHTSSAFPGFDLLMIAIQVTHSGLDFVGPLLLAGAKITPMTIEYAQDTLLALKGTHSGVLALVSGYKEHNRDESDRAAFLATAANLQNVQEEATTNVRQNPLMASMTLKERKEIIEILSRDTKLGLISNVRALLENMTDSQLAVEFSGPIQDAFHLAIKYNWRDEVELFLEHGVNVDRRSFDLAVRYQTTRIVDILLEHNPDIACQEDLFEAIRVAEYEIFMSVLGANGIDVSVADDRGNLPIHKALDFDKRAGVPGRLAIIEELVKLKPPLTAANSDGDLPIHLAAWLGLTDVVRSFIDRLSPVDVENNEGKRPSHLASIKDSVEMLELLLDAGADINAKRKGVGGGPLHYAAVNKACGCTRLLVDQGADLELVSAMEFTPLVLASLNGIWTTSEILIRAGANINAMDPDTHATALTAAAASGAINVVELLLTKHPSLEKRTLDGESPLFLAVANGHIEIVDLLLKSHAKVDANRQGYNGTPLHQAIIHGSVDMVKLLLDYNANQESLDFGLLTPLLLATSNQQWKIAEILIAKGAKVDVRDKTTGSNPLILTSACGATDAIKLLLTSGANVNVTTGGNKYTALMAASSDGNLSSIKLLVDAGADINARDSTARCATALLYAINSGVSSEVIEYLLENGANASDKTADDDSTALMLAVRQGSISNIKILLARDVDVNAQARFTGDTAIHLAVSSLNADVCKLLLDHGVDLNIPSKIGRTIAHTIARAANTEILKHFLSHEVDWKASENASFHNFETETMQYGFSSLHLAVKYNFSGFIKLLYDQ